MAGVSFTFSFLYFTCTEEIARFKGPPVMPEKERSGWGAQDLAGTITLPCNTGTILFESCVWHL